MRKQLLKKLSLNSETLRTLSSSEQLQQVVGNVPTDPNHTVCAYTGCRSICPDSGCQNSVCIC
jgi:hypothetical protein